MRPRALAAGWSMALIASMTVIAGAVEGAPETIESGPGAVVRALEAAIILSGQEGGDIRLAAWSGLFDHADDGAWVVLVVEVDGPALLAGALGDGLEVDVHLYALKEDREVGSALSQRVRIDLARHRELIAVSGLKVPMYVALPRGEHLLRLLVRTGEQAFGIRSLPVSVSAESLADLGARPPVFPDRSGSWLVVTPGGREPTTAPTWLPFSAGDNGPLPAALPVLRSGETTRGSLYLPAASANPTRLEIVLRPAFADTVLRSPLTILERRAAASSPLQVLDFELGEVDLPGGVYTAVIDLNPDSPTVATTKSFNVVVTGDADATVWPQLDMESTQQRSDGTVASSGPSLPVDPGDTTPDQADEEITHRYRQILIDLAAGKFDLACRRLQTLEEPFAKAPGGAGIERLEASQLQASSHLARSGADLFPVMLLHALAAQTYRAAGQSVLASHSIRIVQHLVHEHPHQGQDLDARSAIADLLTEVATGEAEFGNLAQAIVLFEGALARERKHPVALLGLASVYERQGRYADASWILDKLLAQTPAHPEATLRLAINLARQSQTKRARTLLARLTTVDVESWIARLAFQELARVEFDRQRPQQAIDVLLAGLERWPSDFNLSVQLAYCLDAVGRPADGQRVLGSLESTPSGAAEPSARWLYHQPPSWSQKNRLEDLTARAEQWLPGLRQALEVSDTIVAQR